MHEVTHRSVSDRNYNGDMRDFYLEVAEHLLGDSKVDIIGNIKENNGRLKVSGLQLLFDYHPRGKFSLPGDADELTCIYISSIALARYLAGSSEEFQNLSTTLIVPSVKEDNESTFVEAIEALSGLPKNVRFVKDYLTSMVPARVYKALAQEGFSGEKLCEAYLGIVSGDLRLFPSVLEVAYAA